MTLRVPSACSWSRASSQPPVSACRLNMVAAADRDVPAGIRSGANSQSATASTRAIVPLGRRGVIRSFPSGPPSPLPEDRPGGTLRGDPTTGDAEDDVTDPGPISDVPDADRAEQE